MTRCPLCHSELSDKADHTVGELLIRSMVALQEQTDRLVDTQSTEPAVQEQIRRNCETMAGLIRIALEFA